MVIDTQQLPTFFLLHDCTSHNAILHGCLSWVIKCSRTHARQNQTYECPTYLVLPLGVGADDITHDGAVPDPSADEATVTSTRPTANTLPRGRSPPRGSSPSRGHSPRGSSPMARFIRGSSPRAADAGVFSVAACPGQQGCY